ncbi:MAG TPA: alpha/beta hydrolase [Pyrinomonadaceae bacterium]|nr:alpha/beta hydrolase [Pyrinomonadaceae bacterium]
MKNHLRGLFNFRNIFPIASLTLLLCSTMIGQTAKYQSKTADVNGVKIHYLQSGSGPKTLVMIHGFGETSHMWLPAFDEFSKDYTIIAPDMRGIGDSSRPVSGYDKKTVAIDVHELVKSLGKKQIYLVGHDIGLMVAYSYAAQFPAEVEKLVLLEAPIPGIGEMWPSIYNNPQLWHFHFVFSPIALDLVKGRERTFLEHFWQSLSANPASMPEGERKIYTKSYAQPDVMKNAFALFKAFDAEDARDNREFAKTKLPMPLLVIAGDKAMGTALQDQAKIVSDNVTAMIFANTGHWLMSERPAETNAAMKKFFDN